MSVVEARLFLGRHQVGDPRRHDSLEARAVIFQGVLAFAGRAGDWRTGLQNSSFDRGSMGGEQICVLKKRQGECGQMPNLMKRTKCTREYVFRQFWQSFVDDSAIQTKAEFSSAIAVVDKFGGWEEENCVGSRFAASMWIYAKGVICNG